MFSSHIVSGSTKLGVTPSGGDSAGFIEGIGDCGAIAKTEFSEVVDERLTVRLSHNSGKPF